MSRPKPKGGETAARPAVRAAGGIVRRRSNRWPHRWEVVVIHRPRYDDWSFPKGKRDGKEADDQTALREVEEETGLRCLLSSDLGVVEYRDALGRDKAVHYWVMDLADGDVDPPFVPNREVDELRWCRFREAGRLLTYEHDRAFLERWGKVVRG